MKRILALALAVTALTVFAEQSEAQVNGYRFGVGVQQAYVHHGHFQREQPPYFAKFPPVYYNEIVPRNYGVSPYAAPAGVMPVEGIELKPTPTKVVNEFYEKKDVNSAKKNDGKKEEQKKVKSKKAPWDKSAKVIVNPFFLQKMAGK